MKRIVTLKEGILYLPVRPLYLISMQCQGEMNIITVRMCHIFSFDPPRIGTGIHKIRHSYGLMARSREFVVNVPTRELLEAVKLCGQKSGRDVDKFVETGLTAKKGLMVDAPLIEECPVNFECKVDKELDLEERTWYIGEVLTVHVDDEYRNENTIVSWGGHYRTLNGVVLKW